MKQLDCRSCLHMSITFSPSYYEMQNASLGCLDTRVHNNTS